MTEEQTQKLQKLLDHIKNNAIEIIDNQLAHKIRNM